LLENPRRGPARICRPNPGGQISKEGGRSFIFRYERDSRERMMGSGAIHTIDLAKAGERARGARQQLLDGVDPLDARKGAKQAKALDATRLKTFKECADDYLKANRANWRSASLNGRRPFAATPFRSSAILPSAKSTPASSSRFWNK